MRRVITQNRPRRAADPKKPVAIFLAKKQILPMTRPANDDLKTPATTTDRAAMSVIVPAAGCGARAAQNGNKILAPLAGQPLLFYTLFHLLSNAEYGRNRPYLQEAGVHE